MLPQANPETDELAPTQAPPAADAQEPGGYTICIDCKPDGSFEVYKDEAHDAQETMPGPAGAGEGMPTQANEPERQRVDSLEDALKQVIRIQRQNPMDQSYSGQMSAGFQGENRTPY